MWYIRFIAVLLTFEWANPAIDNCAQMYGYNCVVGALSLGYIVLELFIYIRAIKIFENYLTMMSMSLWKWNFRAVDELQANRSDEQQKDEAKANSCK